MPSTSAMPVTRQRGRSMPIKDLCEKYRSRKPRHAVNRAIREELVGGNEVLDALFLVHGLADALQDAGNPIADKAVEAENLLIAARDAMGDEIARRYNFPSARD